MDVFQDPFSPSSKLMHGIAFGYSTGVSHEVVAHTFVFAHRLAEHTSQTTCTSNDGAIHVRLQGEHWLAAAMSHFKAGSFDLIDWFGIRNRYGKATKNAIPSSLAPDHWYTDLAMLTDTGALVQKLLDALSIDGFDDLSFSSGGI